MDKKEITSIAIGRFDGLHLAHFKIFNRLNKNGAVIVIEDDRDKLTPIREKFLKLPCFYYNIKDIKELSGEEFIKKLKKDFINLKKIIVGFDFRFGKNRSSGANDLKHIFDGEICIIQEYKINNIAVHSRVIREFLQNGKVKNANELLGRFYNIEGKIIKGQGLGSRELFATLNIDVQGYILPRNGVYATYTKIDNVIYNSVSFIGKRVSADNKFSIETHIIDKNIQNINIPNLEIYFIYFLRDNIKFDNLKNLKNQIDIDIQQAKEILNAR